MTWSLKGFRWLAEGEEVSAIKGDVEFRFLCRDTGLCVSLRSDISAIIVHCTSGPEYQLYALTEVGRSASHDAPDV